MAKKMKPIKFAPDFGKVIVEMVSAAVYKEETAVGTFVFESAIGDRIVKITVEPTDKELED